MSAERRGRSLVVTGASGFVGRRLLARVAGRYDRIAALSRSVQPPLAGVPWVQGDIREPAGWEHFLDATTDVAHLAAATGGASAGRPPASCSSARSPPASRRTPATRTPPPSARPR